MYFGDEWIIERTKLEREAAENIAAKWASDQLGEAWIGLDTRRVVTMIPRGDDRRLAA
jgi:hypothetical protein